jgi:hypothetical protein
MHPKYMDSTLSLLFRIGRLRGINCPTKGKRLCDANEHPTTTRALSKHLSPLTSRRHCLQVQDSKSRNLPLKRKLSPKATCDKQYCKVNPENDMHPKCMENTLSLLFRIGRLTGIYCPKKGERLCDANEHRTTTRAFWKHRSPLTSRRHCLQVQDSKTRNLPSKRKLSDSRYNLELRDH